MENLAKKRIRWIFVVLPLFMLLSICLEDEKLRFRAGIVEDPFGPRDFLVTRNDTRLPRKGRLRRAKRPCPALCREVSIHARAGPSETRGTRSRSR